jgi:hypothetical protein
MEDVYIPIENLRIKIPKDIEEEDIEQKKYNNLLYFLFIFIENLFKIRIPRFFTIYKIF